MTGQFSGNAAFNTGSFYTYSTDEYGAAAGRATASGGRQHLCVPDQILIAFVAKLKLYGFLCGKGLLTEFLRILENDGAIGLGAARTVGSG